MMDAPDEPSAGNAVPESPRSAGHPAGIAPNPGHRIDIVSNPHRIRVIHRGVTVADSRDALTLSETGLANVVYLPRADVNMARLERSTHTSHCPYKGDAFYFHLRTEDGLVENAVWTYETPFDSVRRIKGYLAFYTSRVDRIDQTS